MASASRGFGISPAGVLSGDFSPFAFSDRQAVNVEKATHSMKKRTRAMHDDLDVHDMRHIETKARREFFEKIEKLAAKLRNSIAAARKGMKKGDKLTVASRIDCQWSNDSQCFIDTVPHQVDFPTPRGCIGVRFYFKEEEQ